MSEDNVQTATDADTNSLRFNIPVGESRQYKVAAIGVSDSEDPNKSDGVRVIAAFVSESDVDVDSCVLAEGSTWPKRNSVATFTRKGEKGPLEVSNIKDEPKEPVETPTAETASQDAPAAEVPAAA